MLVACSPQPTNTPLEVQGSVIYPKYPKRRLSHFFAAFAIVTTATQNWFIQTSELVIQGPVKALDSVASIENMGTYPTLQIGL